MNLSTIERYRHRLELLEGDAKERLRRYERHLQHAEGPVSPDFAEQAVEVENDETIAALHAAVGHELALIRAALQRIKEDRYGRCHQCGKAISEARLTVLPTATLCRNCAAIHSS